MKRVGEKDSGGREREEVEGRREEDSKEVKEKRAEVEKRGDGPRRRGKWRMGKGK